MYSRPSLRQLVFHQQPTTRTAILASFVVLSLAITPTLCANEDPPVEIELFELFRTNQDLEVASIALRQYLEQPEASVQLDLDSFRPDVGVIYSLPIDLDGGFQLRWQIEWSPEDFSSSAGRVTIVLSEIEEFAARHPLSSELIMLSNEPVQLGEHFRQGASSLCDFAVFGAVGPVINDPGQAHEQAQEVGLGLELIPDEVYTPILTGVSVNIKPYRACLPLVTQNVANCLWLHFPCHYVKWKKTWWGGYPVWRSGTCQYQGFWSLPQCKCE